MWSIFNQIRDIHPFKAPRFGIFAGYQMTSVFQFPVDKLRALFLPSLVSL